MLEVCERTFSRCTRTGGANLAPGAPAWSRKGKTADCPTVAAVSSNAVPVAAKNSRIGCVLVNGRGQQRNTCLGAAGDLGVVDEGVLGRHVGKQENSDRCDVAATRSQSPEDS